MGCSWTGYDIRSSANITRIELPFTLEEVNESNEEEEEIANDSFLDELLREGGEYMVSHHEERKAPVVSLASRCEVEITCVDDHVRTTTKQTANWRTHVAVTKI